MPPASAGAAVPTLCYALLSLYLLLCVWMKQWKMSAELTTIKFISRPNIVHLSTEQHGLIVCYICFNVILIGARILVQHFSDNLTHTEQGRSSSQRLAGKDVTVELRQTSHLYI